MAPIKSVILGSAAALASFGLASATSCSGPVIGGITYCNPVNQITYDKLGFSSTYQDVTGMDFKSCSCSYAPKAFSGPLAPLNEGLSLHFRGPLLLKQFGVYYPAPPKKTAKRSNAHHHHLGRHHAHHKRHVKVQTVTQTIIVDPAGSTIWPKPTSTKAPGQLYGGSPVPTPSPGNGGGNGEGEGTGDDDKPKFVYPDAGDDSSAPTDGWVRAAYYNAEAQTSEGLVFMNHKGGEESGDWDICAGNSVSYMAPNTVAASKTPQILQNSKINTRDEFIIFSDKKCTTETCGFYRPGIPAYQGFAGDKKVFVFEFSMPEDVTKTGINDDMPAIWALNSKIPRTAQYGFKDTACSCWASGCGELDLFEVLQDANSMIKTHYHSKQGIYGGGGDINYFKRPYDSTIKAAVTFDGKNAVNIKILDPSTVFGDYFTTDSPECKEITGKIAGILASVFSL